MSRVAIYIVVEGQTEQTFIRDVLAPELAIKNLDLHPVLIGKPGHKGGDIRFARAEDDIGKFLRQNRNTYISTMINFYGIDHNWPGRIEVHQQIQRGRKLSSAQKAEILEKETKCKIIEDFPGYNAEHRFIPYFEMHEFEALLFSDVEILADKMEIDASLINEILAEYDNPEEIDNHPDTAPSARLKALKNGYRKISMGKSVSESIGIQAIRNQCPHFNAWLTKLENLTAEIISSSSPVSKLQT